MHIVTASLCRETVRGNNSRSEDLAELYMKGMLPVRAIIGLQYIGINHQLDEELHRMWLRITSALLYPLLIYTLHSKGLRTILHLGCSILCSLNGRLVATLYSLRGSSRRS